MASQGFARCCEPNAQNQGPSVARNLAMERAKGEFIAYLDCDDELDPDYCEHIRQFAIKGDLLFFGYDYVSDDADGLPVTGELGPAGDASGFLSAQPKRAPRRVTSTQPSQASGGLPSGTLAGGGIGDLWRRFGRTGAEVILLPLKSGRYHFRSGSLTDARESPIFRMRCTIQTERLGDPFTGELIPAGSPRTGMPSVLYASAICPFDFHSDVALAIWETLHVLAGVPCHASQSAWASSVLIGKSTRRQFWPIVRTAWHSDAECGTGGAACCMRACRVLPAAVPNAVLYTRRFRAR